MEERAVYLLKIDLGIGTHTRFANKVHNPLLAFVTGEVETFGEVTARKAR